VQIIKRLFIMKNLKFSVSILLVFFLLVSCTKGNDSTEEKAGDFYSRQ